MSHLPSSPQHSAGLQSLLVGVSGPGGRMAKTLPKGDTAQSRDLGEGSGAHASPTWDSDRRDAVTPEALPQGARKSISPDLESGLPRERHGV